MMFGTVKEMKRKGRTVVCIGARAITLVHALNFFNFQIYHLESFSNTLSWPFIPFHAI